MKRARGSPIRRGRDMAPARRGLSVIEAVALVPVVGLALAALAAATQRSAQEDNLDSCLANMRAIGQASLAYAAEDASEFFIPVPALQTLPDYPGVFEWGGKAGSGSRTILSDIATSYYGTAYYHGPAHRPLNRYLYRAPFNDWNPINGTPQPGPANANWINDTRLNLDIYRCPSDSGYVGGGFAYTGGRHRANSELPFKENREGLASAYDYYGTSYVANALWFTGSQLLSYSVYFRALSGVPAPADSVGYLEVPFRYSWMWGDWSDPSCSWTERQQACQGNFATIAGWHGVGFSGNVTFADGHSAFLTMKGCMRPPPNLGSSSYPPQDCSPTVEPYVCFRCITVRGTGWQMDTLPASPIVMPWYNPGRVIQSPWDKQLERG